VIEAVNDSEQFVYDICTKSFLSLWSYINPQGKTPGKELCDVLVVCDPHVIVISVKDIQLKHTKDPSVDWQRWQRRAIKDSIKQIKGAIRHLDRSEYVVQKDGSRGLKLPLANERMYHRMAVAFGANNRQAPISMTTENNDFYHILDEQSVHLLLRHLDTISDFVNYLIDKTEFLSNTLVTVKGGEENLLACYLHGNRQFPLTHDIANLGSDLWDAISQKPEFKAKLKKDDVSYTWDRLIEALCNGEFVGEEWLGSDMSEAEVAIRVLVKENRFSRRMLSNAFTEYLKLRRMENMDVRSVKSDNDVTYVFFAYENSSSPEERKRMLLVRCFASLCEFPGCFTVIGIGVSVAGLSLEEWELEELVPLQTQHNQWSKEYLRKAKFYRAELSSNSYLTKTQIHDAEYPRPIPNTLKED